MSGVLQAAAGVVLVALAAVIVWLLIRWSLAKLYNALANMLDVLWPR